MIAAAAFALTGAAAVGLTVLAHQAWLPVLTSVLILVPGLYLAFKAIPSTPRRAHGLAARAWDPVTLGVHQVASGGALPPYVRRPHDDLLDALLDPDVTASRLVVLRNGSSTGKSRAAFEAVARGKLARWRLEYPRGEADLTALLDAGVPVRTVVWLGELRDYTSGQDGGAAVLGRLAYLLETQDKMIAVTTMWPGHWDNYIEAARTREDLSHASAGTAGQLLDRLPVLTGRAPADVVPARGGVIDIPAVFTLAEVIEAARTDPRLADAAEAAASARDEGQIAQYLAGVPDLLGRLHGPGDRYGQAVILAAMDAARLGCEDPLPASYLTQAAGGYLTDHERTLDAGVWAGPALAWGTEKLKGAIQAVRPIPHSHGTGTTGYRPADYLEQYGRSTRQHQIGTAELWDALTAHITGAADLTRLARTAERYGLYRQAADLLTQAAVRGDSFTAAELVRLLHRAAPDNVPLAARWTAGHASLADPASVTVLLKVLRVCGADDAANTLDR
jgi:hypothetical protein